MYGENESFEVGKNVLLLTIREKVSVAGASEQRGKEMKIERWAGSGEAGPPAPISHVKDYWTLPLEALGSDPYSLIKGVV